MQDSNVWIVDLSGYFGNFIIPNVQQFEAFIWKRQNLGDFIITYIQFLQIVRVYSW